mgnify:CR=1 FL=1
MKTKLININYFFGIVVGLTYPDFDFFLIDYIGHRSILTHSVIIFLLFFILLKNSNEFKKLYFISGMCLGLIIHLFSDMELPSQFIGLKTIKFFSYDLLYLSFYWMIINILIAYYFFEKLANLLKFNRKNYYILNYVIGAIFIYINSENYFILTKIFIIFSLLINFFFKKFTTVF